ncbi:response regulator [uncultured Cohaesibacter sp.]|uniref:response regulator n=1 Tax=uncultured Cohaesibacter sp. TaxID=1002546 RepID=UPI0029C7FD87|nr:response regulator [uncultured Cohaesibacter sp.]
MTKPNASNKQSLLQRLLTAIWFPRSEKNAVPTDTSGVLPDPADRPIVPAPEPSAPKTLRAPTSFQGLVNLTVLVVEDIDSTRQSICQMLEELGHSYVEATNGSEAIAIAETRTPDVILMDMSLPDIDGWEAARLLRNHSNSQLAKIPIVAMTNRLTFSEQTQQSNISAFLTKPFDSQSLAETLKTTTIDNAFEASENPETLDKELLPLFDPSILMQDRTELGQERVNELIERFLKVAPSFSDTIYQTASETERRQQAEILKGAANNLGLLRLAETAARIERGEAPSDLERVLRESIRCLKSAV